MTSWEAVHQENNPFMLPGKMSLFHSFSSLSLPANCVLQLGEGVRPAWVGGERLNSLDLKMQAT